MDIHTFCGCVKPAGGEDIDLGIGNNIKKVEIRIYVLFLFKKKFIYF